MPIYDYKCKECEHVQEESHSWKEEPVIQCVKCGSTKTHRVVLSAPRIVQKSPWQGG